MLNVRVNPVLVTAVITVVIELLILPVFDACTELWAGARNRAILRKNGSSSLHNDDTVIAGVRGVFLSKTHLLSLSFLKKALFVCLLVSEFFIDPVPLDQTQPRTGPAVVALNDFRDPLLQSEEAVREVPYLRNICIENGTRFETVFVDNMPLCSSKRLFTAVPIIGEAREYDLEGECAVGDLFNTTTTTCEGNKIKVACDEFTTVDSCFSVKMMKLVSDRRIQVATTDSEDALFSDVIDLTFEIPITPKLIEHLGRNFGSNNAIMVVTILTSTALRFDGNNIIDSVVPQRTIVAQTGQTVGTSISIVTIVLLSSAVAILVICLIGVAIEVMLRLKDVESKRIQPVNNLGAILSVAARDGSPLGSEVCKDVEVRVVTKGGVPHQIFARNCDEERVASGKELLRSEGDVHPEDSSLAVDHP